MVRKSWEVNGLGSPYPSPSPREEGGVPARPNPAPGSRGGPKPLREKGWVASSLPSSSLGLGVERGLEEGGGFSRAL